MDNRWGTYKIVSNLYTQSRLTNNYMRMCKSYHHDMKQKLISAIEGRRLNAMHIYESPLKGVRDIYIELPYGVSLLLEVIASERK